ncbi:hypothetical protein [Okeania sp. KiyG1]|uniref:hypothetical protein n=1 Tax=Okeania sp. KiyG1 TaxID=2720165 RepID=UPI0019244834|nr:hypothetical protein [Okeania sp. KiyG1]GGA30113.1 hypothetical protein CYANOKiyG1_46660 [Okeania sp. KiyG1]
MITIELQDDVIEVGKQLSGKFSWAGNITPHEINLKVGWRTEGRGNVDTKTVYSNSFVGTTHSTFSCKIPALGPVSYDGEIIRVIWEVIIATKFSRKLNSKEKGKKVKLFRVIPRGA